MLRITSISGSEFNVILSHKIVTENYLAIGQTFEGCEFPFDECHKMYIFIPKFLQLTLTYPTNPPKNGYFPQLHQSLVYKIETKIKHPSDDANALMHGS